MTGSTISHGGHDGALGPDGFPENLVERGDAPVVRAASPLWKVAFLALLLSGGIGALAAVLLPELRGPAAPAEPEETRSRLRFDAGELELPAFPRPAPPEPEPLPVPVEPVIEEPALALPELPPPEPRMGYTPAPPAPYVPPAPTAPASPPPPSPEESAWERRLSAPLSGSGSGSAAATSAGAGQGTESGRGGIDLSTTRTATAFARRLSDMTFLLPKGTYLPCVLDTAIQSDQAGMVACTLPRDVYGADGTPESAPTSARSRLAGPGRVPHRDPDLRQAAHLRGLGPGAHARGRRGRHRPPRHRPARAGRHGRQDRQPLLAAGRHPGADVGGLLRHRELGARAAHQRPGAVDRADHQRQPVHGPRPNALNSLAKIKPTLHKHQGASINILVARDVDLAPVYRLSRR